MVKKIHHLVEYIAVRLAPAHYTLSHLINSEVKELLSHFSLIGSDPLAHGASKGAEILRPDPEVLARVHMFERYIVYLPPFHLLAASINLVDCYSKSFNQLRP